jgi:hypothetical protein
MKVDESKPLREQTRRIEIAGRKFDIPIMYMNGHPEKGEHQESLLLGVIWPDMKSIYELQNRDEYKKVTFEEKRRGDILLEPVANRPSFDVQISNREKNLTKLEYAGLEHGLKKYRHYHGTKEKPELWDEVYIQKDHSQHIIRFISCSAYKEAVTSVCVHKFINKNLIFDISYNKKNFFKDWKKQADRAVHFIDSFEVKENKGEN